MKEDAVAQSETLPKTHRKQCYPLPVAYSRSWCPWGQSQLVHRTKDTKNGCYLENTPTSRTCIPCQWAWGKSEGDVLVPVSIAVLSGKRVASLPQPQGDNGGVHPWAGSPGNLVSTPGKLTSAYWNQGLKVQGLFRRTQHHAPADTTKSFMQSFIHSANKVNRRSAPCKALPFDLCNWNSIQKGKIIFLLLWIPTDPCKRLGRVRKWASR